MFLSYPSISALFLGLTSLLTPSSIQAFQIQQQRNHIKNVHSGRDVVGCDNEELDVTMGRRAFWTQSGVAVAGASIASLLPSVAVADESDLASSNMKSFEDPDYGFRIKVPSSFERTEQNLSGRRKGVFFVDGGGNTDVETLIFVAYTPVRDDFTGLASFGSVDQVGQATILPRGALAGGEDMAESKMISAVSKKNAYFYDYVVAPQGEGAPKKKQHYRTIFTLLPLLKGPPQAGLTLVTITAQTTEEKYSEGGLGKIFDDVIDSFGKL